MVQRFVAQQVRDALTDTPVVLLQGPRQSGKSTLASQIANEVFGGNSITLDDPIALADARRNPSSFLQSRGRPILIDEVQRAPELFLALKLLVDKDRKPGQFLLTGSSNVLLMPKIADSLAGRMEPIELMPFTQAEVRGSTDNWVDNLFGEDLQPKPPKGSDDLLSILIKGGFPEPIGRASEARRDAWFQSYVRTILDRDVRDLANVSGLAQLPRLLALLAARSGQTLNISSLSVDTGIPQTTLTRYIDLFRALFLIVQVPAWSLDSDNRLAKSPKIFLVDTGLQAYLLGTQADGLKRDPLRFESALKTLIANELIRLSNFSSIRPWVYHLRTVKQKEVDFVLEARDGRVIGVNVRTEHAAASQDLEGFKLLSELVGDRFIRGVVLHCGTESRNLGSNCWSLPVDSLWN